MPDKPTTRFKRVQAGQYATGNGLFLIEQQHYERECDCLACQSGSPDCPHDGVAVDWFWHVWDVAEDNYATETRFDTLREAKEWFA